MGLLQAAFNALARLHSRAATLKRFGSPDIETPIRITPSNYFRNLEGPSHTIIRGREFIIPLSSIVSPFDPVLKRGDKIIDPVFGSMAIDEITEMCDLGGDVMAYRCRCE